MNSADIYCCENFWVIFYQHEVLIAMVCFGDNVYSFSWKFISQKRNPKKKTKTCYKNEKACWEIKQSEKVFNLISLFLPAMGGISPYKYVTWQQPVGIGLTQKCWDEQRPVSWIIYLLTFWKMRVFCWDHKLQNIFNLIIQSFGDLKT